VSTSPAPLARRLAALRGATTLEVDTRDEVMARTSEMLGQLMVRNGLSTLDVVSLVFTATDDIHSEFPAAAVRAAGIADVPMICARELAITGGSGIPLCIRVMAHVYSDRPRADLRHVYLHGARQLRSDLPE
jgi:chorismate mutase